MATIQNKVNLSSFTSAGLNTGVAPSSLCPGLETFYDDQASQHIIGLMIYVIKLARVLTEYIIRTGKEGVEKNPVQYLHKDVLVGLTIVTRDRGSLSRNT